MEILRFFLHKNIYFIMILTILLFLTGCSSNSSAIIPPDWTIMVYLDGDDEQLEASALVDFNEMEKGLYQADTNIKNNLNILVMVDRYTGGIETITDQGDSDWTDTRMYLVKPDDNIKFFNSERLDDGSDIAYHTLECGEKNMGAPSTLSDFIEFSIDKFPADHYALILWNHGGGAQKKSLPKTQQSPRKAICWDSDNNNDTLYLDELQQALSDNFSLNRKLDIIGFDACIMATIEIAYEFRDLVDYMVGSMNYIQDNGWSYDRIFGNITASAMNPADFSTHIVKSYQAYIETHPATQGWGESISATDLSQISNLADKVNTLAVAIYEEDKQISIEEIRENSLHYFEENHDSVSYPYFDLHDLSKNINEGDFSLNLTTAAEDVITALSSSILYSYGDTAVIEYTGQSRTAYYGTGSKTSKGLSVFFSRGDKFYDSLPHYKYQWWYTSENTADYFNDTSYLYGKIDFCTSNNNGDVESWRELMEAWYDNPNYYTPSSF